MSDYQPMTCLPVLALRGLVVFPGCVTHFDVGRTKSVRSVEEAMRANQTIFLVAQRDLETDDPKKADRGTTCGFWSRDSTARSCST